MAEGCEKWARTGSATSRPGPRRDHAGLRVGFAGVSAYAAPLISTMILMGAGITPASPRIAIAALLITAGAALTARAGAQKDRLSSG